MLIPNSDRAIVKRVDYDRVVDQQIVLPGQLKAGENLYVGEIVRLSGDTSDQTPEYFRVGQVVYYSEYSAAALVDMGAVLKGEMSIGDAMRKENLLYVVSLDDIMAYEEDEIDIDAIKKKIKEDRDAGKVQPTTQESKPQIITKG